MTGPVTVAYLSLTGLVILGAMLLIIEVLPKRWNRWLTWVMSGLGPLWFVVSLVLATES